MNDLFVCLGCINFLLSAIALICAVVFANRQLATDDAVEKLRKDVDQLIADVGSIESRLQTAGRTADACDQRTQIAEQDLAILRRQLKQFENGLSGLVNDLDDSADVVREPESPTSEPEPQLDIVDGCGGRFRFQPGEYHVEFGREDYEVPNLNDVREFRPANYFTTLRLPPGVMIRDLRK